MPRLWTMLPYLDEVAITPEIESSTIDMLIAGALDAENDNKYRMGMYRMLFQREGFSDIVLSVAQGMLLEGELVLRVEIYLLLCAALHYAHSGQGDILLPDVCNDEVQDIISIASGEQEELLLPMCWIVRHGCQDSKITSEVANFLEHIDITIRELPSSQLRSIRIKNICKRVAVKIQNGEHPLPPLI